MGRTAFDRSPRRKSPHGREPTFRCLAWMPGIRKWRIREPVADPRASRERPSKFLASADAELGKTVVALPSRTARNGDRITTAGRTPIYRPLPHSS
jgi:hypothetical protein